MEFLHQKLGPQAMVRDLVELGVKDTPPNNPYEDKSQNAETVLMLYKEPELFSEWVVQYVNIEILLLRGNRMATDWVVHWKHDADGNPIGRSNQNPILDTRLCDVEFHGGEMTELAAIIIAKSMYVQCDVHKNEYHLLEAFIDDRKIQLSV